MTNRFTLFSDPVHGFISVPRTLLLDLIRAPEVQRLRRIRQLGVGYLVFPGAEHSRFGHALGAMALMHDALISLQEKGVSVSPDEREAALAAALLHDIGHGPFSHTLEPLLIRGFHHEAMSRVLLSRLNAQHGGALDLTIRIFDGTYERPFFHDLVSGQLDMDRLDYLRRDSYYTGVIEGRVGVERIIKTLSIVDIDGSERLVIERKGMPAVENYLLSRRLMYWQVYLHKTVLAGDHVLRSVLERARQLIRLGQRSAVESGSSAFLFFLENDISSEGLADAEVLEAYCGLDDADMLYSIKQWVRSPDRILQDLACRFMDRRLFRVAFLEDPKTTDTVSAWRDRVATYLIQTGLSSASTVASDVALYLTTSAASHVAYDPDDSAIMVLNRDGSVTDLSVAAGEWAGLTGAESRPYVAHPKEVHIS